MNKLFKNDLNEIISFENNLDLSWYDWWNYWNVIIYISISGIILIIFLFIYNSIRESSDKIDLIRNEPNVDEIVNDLLYQKRLTL